MGYSILTGDDFAISKTSANVVAKHAVDSGNHADTLVDTTDDAEQVDGRFEGASEEASAGQEEVADRSGRKIKGGMRRSGTFEDFKIEMVEHAAD